MTEKKLLKFLEDFGLEYRIFDDPQFICSNALKRKTVKSISIGHWGAIDFNFDTKGKFIGTNTCSVNSFIPAGKKRPVKDKT